MGTQSFTNGPNFSYGYDQGSNGVGRLGAITEGSAGSTQYGCDAFGRVTSKAQTLHGRTLTVGYGYAAGGKLNRITYPSGKVLTYTFDDASRIRSLSLDGAVLLQQVSWQPFGQPTGWTWGNGSTLQRSYDLDGRIKLLVMPQLSEEQQNFGYDGLYRLTTAASVAASVMVSYAYGATGNRTQESTNGASILYTTDPASNRLTAISGSMPRTFSFNANGSIINDSGSLWSYDGRERLVVAGATSY